MRLKTPFEKWLETPNDKGLHQEIFAAACFLLEEGRSKEKVFNILRKACDRVEDRPVPDREIQSAIEGASRRVTGEVPRGPVWPRYDHEFKLQALKLYPVDENKLRRGVPGDLPVLHYLRSLYKESDLLCIGKTAREFCTVQLRTIAKSSDLSLCQFINPSPMINLFGLTEECSYSAHAKSNTGPRVYGVVEFDGGTLLEHASILRYLGTLMPLVMIVYSGSKSLHGWFNMYSTPEAKVLKFYETAVSLGADSRMYSPCQFTRLPMGKNAVTGRTQRVVYFNATGL